MQDQNNIPESVWADGCPQNVKPEDVIGQQELLGMSIDHLMKNVIIPGGYKPDQGFPRLQYPNIVCSKDDVKYAIVVSPSVYPSYVTMTDESRIQFASFCIEHNIVPLFAGIGYKSIDNDRANAGMVLRGDVFLTSFPGFIKLTTEEHQSFMVKKEDMFKA